MSTTYRSFVDALEALDISGVNRQYDQGPPIAQVGVADCPFQYVRYPGSDEERAIVFGEQGGYYEMHADLVVCVEPVGQNVGPENFDDTVDMMDAVQTALQGMGCITDSKSAWNLKQTIDTVAGQEYWAVVAQVRGYSVG